ncbi:cupin domain-containing protein [Belnapia sp. T18]|uniref:Cupin domain-containing protein n=1 Tax=Belnapia arida TaxID=2804533 RepID=A0ABS1U9M9_9PROT|nr:cupin domain-containing protein [Belnapia arida]MBL6081381.1 cupin domain-containing protein [Belnapia arida]
MADRQAHSVLLPGVRNARLRRLAPGIRHAVLLRGPDGETLRLLRIKPGTALPRHSHRGTELTLVLKGAFADETGHYGPGGLAPPLRTVLHG